MPIADPGVVAKMTTDVADGPILFRSLPTAHLAGLPTLHRGYTPEPPVTEVLEKRSEVFLDLFFRVPTALEGHFNVGPSVEVFPLSEFIGRYANSNQGSLGLFP